MLYILFAAITGLGILAIDCAAQSRRPIRSTDIPAASVYEIAHYRQTKRSA